MRAIKKLLKAFIAIIILIPFITNPLNATEKNGRQKIEKKLIIADPGQNIYSNGLLRIPRNYTQAQDGRIIIEAEEPTRFISQDAKEPIKTFRGKDKDCSNGGYTAFLKRGWYSIDIKNPKELILWYRASFPTTGHWCHNENLDDEKSSLITDNHSTDPKDPILRQWVWKKGKPYHFSAGTHIFSFDWQGGAKLDQLAFLPHGAAPNDREYFSPTYGRIDDTSKACTANLILQPDQKLEGFKFDAEPAGGKVAASYSIDNGKQWQAVPVDGSFGNAKLPRKGSVMFQITLSASRATHSSPTVYNLSADLSSPLKDTSKDSIPEECLWKTNSLKLVPAEWSGIRPDKHGWQLAEPTQPGEDGTIWLDTANADKLIIAPKQVSWIIKDKDAFSGKALYQGVLNRNLVSFDIHVPEKKMYRPWFRVRLFRENISFRVPDLPVLKKPYCPLLTYQFDRQNLIRVDYSREKSFPVKAFKSREWVWIQGKIIALRKGGHTFRVRSGLDYMLLDRIALVPGGGKRPQNKGGQSEKKISSSGEIFFKTLNWPANKNGKTITFSGDLAGGEMSYAFSPDNGKTWQVITGKSLPGKGEKPSVLTLKAVLRPAQNGTTPKIQHWQLNLQKEQAKAIVLANQQQKIFFCKRSGALMGWWTKKAGWIIPPHTKQSLFSFAIGMPGSGLIRMTPTPGDLIEQKIKIRRNKRILRQRYQLAGNSVFVDIKIALPLYGLSQWQIEVENNSKQDIRNLEFPVLSHLRIGNDPENNWTVAMSPNHTAADFPGAPFQIAGKGINSTGPGSKTSGLYPGWYAMGWLSLYTPDQGAFTAQVRDTDGIGTDIRLEKDPQALAVQASLTRRIFIGPGKKSKAHYELGWHDGDWHKSADLYSTWAHSWMDFSNVNANWTRDADGWIKSWHYVSTSLASRYITHLLPETQWLGATYAQHFSSPVASTLPFINPKLGTSEEFRKAHQGSHKQGLFHSYYWTCRGWIDWYSEVENIESMPRKHLPPEFKIPPKGFGPPLAIKDETGSIRSWGYHYSKKDMMLCPSSDGWQEFMIKGMAKNYSKLQGASGVYSDEACGYVECFVDKHGHNKQHGTWAKGLQNVYRQALTAARKDNPHFSIAIEGSPDQLLQYADFGLWGMSEYSDGIPLLYTFPEIKLLRGTSNPGGYWARTAEEYTRFIHLFLRFDDVSFASNIRQFFAHRKRIKDWMYQKPFMDDVDLSVNKPGIIAKWFKTKLPDRTGALINIQNEYQVEGAVVSIMRPELRHAKGAFVYLFDEEEILPGVLTKTDNGITVTVPSAKASSIIVPVKVPGNETIRAHLVWPQESGPDKLVIYLLNFGGNKKRTSLKYSLPQGIRLTDPPAEVSIAAGRMKKIIITMTGMEILKNRGKVKVTIRSGKVKKEISRIVAPPLYNGDFEHDSTGKGTPDGWRTIGHYWYTHLANNPKITEEFLHNADGILDSENPANGNHSLRLDGSVELPYIWGSTWRKNPEKAPIKPWYFNTAHHLILKPDTRYRVLFKYRKPDKNGFLEVTSTPVGIEYRSVPATFPPRKVSAQKGNPAWQEYSFEFDMPLNRSETDLVFANKSKSPIWIDGVKVKAVGPAKKVIKTVKKTPTAKHKALPASGKAHTLEGRGKLTEKLSEELIGAWAVYGKDITETSIKLIMNTKEGIPVMEKIDGQQAMGIRSGGADYAMVYYFRLSEWMYDFTREQDVFLEYFDGAPGKVSFRYTGERFPRGLENIDGTPIQLTGSREWKIFKSKIINPVFKSQGNYGSDIQIAIYKPIKDFAIKSIAVLEPGQIK